MDKKSTHPFAPEIPEGATKLIIGTMPPYRFCNTDEALYDDDVNFYYGSRDNYPDGGPYFTRRAMKLPEKYYAKAFDAFCESPEECRDRLESLRNEDAELFPNGITGELVDSTFAKYLAVKRYTLPMLTNTSEFNYFSFYRHILLYVVEHDTHPEFPVPDTGYKYPPLPGMSECDIDFDY